MREVNSVNDWKSTIGWNFVMVICVVKLVNWTLRNLMIWFKNLHSLLDFGKHFNFMFLENLQKVIISNFTVKSKCFCSFWSGLWSLAFFSELKPKFYYKYNLFKIPKCCGGSWLDCIGSSQMIYVEAERVWFAGCVHFVELLCNFFACFLVRIKL